MDPWLEINSELTCQSFRRHPAWLLHTWKMGIYPGFLADILQTGQNLSTCTSLQICWSICWEKRPELSWASHSGTAWGTESWRWYPCCGASPPVQKRVNMAGLRLPPSERPGRVVLWWHMGTWMSGQIPPFPELKTLSVPNCLYAEYLLFWWEFGILVYARESVPTWPISKTLTLCISWESLATAHCCRNQAHPMQFYQEITSGNLCLVPTDFTLCAISLHQFCFWILVL